MEVSLSKYDAIAGENLGANKAVYFSAADTVKLAKADSDTTLPCVGFTEHAANNGQTVLVFTNDVLDGFSGLTPRANYYLSQDTAGEITSTKPTSGIAIRVGTAKSTTELDIHIYREGDFQEHLIWADQLRPPASSYPITAIADLNEDSNSGFPVIQFDETTEEARVFDFKIPEGASYLKIWLRTRAETGAASNLDVVPRIRCREQPDNTAVESFDSGTDLTVVTMGTSNEFFQYDFQEIALSTLNLVAGRMAEIILSRNTGSGSDTLVGDWTLRLLIIGFR